MHDRLWERFLTALEGKLPPQALDTWIRPGRVVAQRDNHLEIGVPSKFIRNYVVEHYLSDLLAAAAACLGPRAQITVSPEATTGQCRRSQSGTFRTWNRVFSFSEPPVPRGRYRSPGRQFRSHRGRGVRSQSRYAQFSLYS